jgi:hypothetical protein
VNQQPDFESDLEKINELFPKLKLNRSENVSPFLEGKIDICDQEGLYWNTFEVKITMPVDYPFGVPRMQEVGNQIERIDDRHIDSDGWCCVAIPHALEMRAIRGLTIIEYLREFGYPYLVNQVFFQVEGRYAGFEYKHGFAGVIQFYQQLLQTQDKAVIARFLKGYINGHLPRYLDRCWCGSNRTYRKCHVTAINRLKSLNKKRISFDCIQFEQYLSA